jgi:hypothetical protein
MWYVYYKCLGCWHDEIIFIRSYRIQVYCECMNQLWHILLPNILFIKDWFGFMVFNATFNNISVISLWSVLFVEETVPEKTIDLLWVADKLHHIILLKVVLNTISLTLFKIILSILIFYLYFYRDLQKLKNLLVRTKFYWSWAGGLMLMMRTALGLV